ncbi:MAG: hypothetical protein AAFP86_14685, partial [Planctomycetota bacterium]
MPAGSQELRGWMPYEAWIVGPAQSNWEGAYTSLEPDLDGEDAPDPRIFMAYQPDIPHDEQANNWRAPQADDDMIVMRYPISGTPNPADRDTDGSPDFPMVVGPYMAFAKRRVEQFPQIREICFIIRPRGGSSVITTPTFPTAGQWAPGGLFNEAAKTRAQAFFAKYPRFRLAGMLGDVGASERADDYLTEYLPALNTAVEDIRAVCPGGDEAVYVLTQMPRIFRDAVQQTREIDELMQNVSGTVARSAFVFLDDLDTTGEDTAHFDGVQIRELGRRAADAAGSLTQFAAGPAEVKIRLQYAPAVGEFRDVYSGGHIVYDGVYALDDERGYVLDGTDGFDTSILLPDDGEDRYTIAGWFRRKEDPGAPNNHTNDSFFG